ncbi:TraR/DksA family transcriptional regulator [Synoicihabitans lomoniglobus]|uniref:TraR/DksA C4-type zinc finger protein n=1 Tax=Synoicihabitans lomoniglobus TaxID=2909285 RepID=A0AAF0CQL3_9BACT|nr:TraR/DksA C4-type zinc finger protein [Opitutaceae bacterium LMO-M01]WED66260.1 TraR/DksA C4-type zinc finger protein [Opitutaceae bacterium LMO-M01]
MSSSGKAKPTAKTAKKSSARDALRSRALGRSKSNKSIAFSLDEVKEIAKTSSAKEDAEATKKAAKTADKKAVIEATLAAAKPSVVAAASLADILGFTPGGGKKSAYDDPKSVPEKYRRYYKLLLELREHLTGQIDQHSEDTLKRSSKDDAGDLSSYGQHMADAGTDTFDRDFALSLVANEQEALSEIEAAITRIKNGTYGICEVTGEPIDKERLLAVPFTRNSAAAQKQLERNRHRVRTQAGLLGDFGEDGGSMGSSGDED